MRGRKEKKKEFLQCRRKEERKFGKENTFFGWRSGQHYSTVGFDLRFRSEGEIQAPLLVSSVPKCRRAHRESLFR